MKKIFGESYAKEFRKISLTDKTVGRISDISEDACDELVNQLKNPHFLHCKYMK
jgi:hypothetical protein